MTHIAVDMDDVVVDFVGGLLASIKTEYNVDIPAEDITEWDLHPLLDPIIGRSWWSWLQEREWLWARFPAIPGAIGSIDTLRRQGHYLELVTSKPKWAEHNVWKWLGHWRPAFNRVTIVSLETRKVDVTNAAIIIDDKLQTCRDFIEIDREAILFGSMQNRGAWAGSPRRADSWSEVLTQIERISTNGW